MVLLEGQKRSPCNLIQYPHPPTPARAFSKAGAAAPGTVGTLRHDFAQALRLSLHCGLMTAFVTFCGGIAPFCVGVLAACRYLSVAEQRFSSFFMSFFELLCTALETASAKRGRRHLALAEGERRGMAGPPPVADPPCP